MVAPNKIAPNTDAPAINPICAVVNPLVVVVAAAAAVEEDAIVDAVEEDSVEEVEGSMTPLPPLSAPVLSSPPVDEEDDEETVLLETNPDACWHCTPFHSMGQLQLDPTSTPPLKQVALRQNCPPNGSTQLHRVLLVGST
jgi:hypothetical protein